MITGFEHDAFSALILVRSSIKQQAQRWRRSATGINAQTNGGRRSGVNMTSASPVARNPRNRNNEQRRALCHALQLRSKHDRLRSSMLKETTTLADDVYTEVIVLELVRRSYYWIIGSVAVRTQFPSGDSYDRRAKFP